MSFSANHFELFDLPVSFEVVTEILTQRYRELQRVTHPDNYVNASDRERRLAMQKTAQINEAFQTLKHPLTRGHYLLQLQGIAVNDPQNTVMDSEFLMMQIELREELADIKHHSQPLETLNHFLNRLTQQMQTLTAKLSQQFAQQDYSAAGDSVRQYQFFQRLYEEALALEETLS